MGRHQNHVYTVLATRCWWMPLDSAGRAGEAKNIANPIRKYFCGTGRLFPISAEDAEITWGAPSVIQLPPIASSIG
jgi:hypothetical protein